MNLSFADRDFYYGDPYFAPTEPMKGLLSKDYAKQRAALIKPAMNDAGISPGDPYPFEGKTNPITELLTSCLTTAGCVGCVDRRRPRRVRNFSTGSNRHKLFLLRIAADFTLRRR